MAFGKQVHDWTTNGVMKLDEALPIKESKSEPEGLTIQTKPHKPTESIRENKGGGKKNRALSRLRKHR